MANVLSEAKRLQVVALGRLGWSLRRIQEATAIRRETASEILAEFGVAPTPPVPLVVRLIGALLLGFAALNWLAKEMVVGGVYGRPVVVGNLAHFVIGTLASLRAAAGGDSLAIRAVTGVYAGFAVWFGIVLFTRPSEAKGP
jgi:hypothetical protein